MPLVLQPLLFFKGILVSIIMPICVFMTGICVFTLLDDELMKLNWKLSFNSLRAHLHFNQNANRYINLSFMSLYHSDIPGRRLFCLRIRRISCWHPALAAAAQESRTSVSVSPMAFIINGLQWQEGPKEQVSKTLYLIHDEGYAMQLQGSVPSFR